MAIPSFDSIRPSWESSFKDQGALIKNPFAAPSVIRSRRVGVQTGDLFVKWTDMPIADHEALEAIYELVGQRKPVAFTPAGDASASAWRIVSFTQESNTTHNTNATLRLLSESVAT